MRSVAVTCIGLVSWILIASLGVWGQEVRTGRYPDGRLRYTGLFKDGQPVGELLRYYPDATLQARFNHRGDTVDAVLYSRNGECTSRGTYLRKLKTGNWEYYKGERLLLSETYAGGLLQGPVIRYFASGGVAEKKYWQQGLPQGEWTLYYENGKIRTQACFLAGKLNGLLKAYDYDGNLQTEGRYEADLKEGIWRFYDRQGRVTRELNYHKGIPDNADEIIRQESRELDDLVEQGKKIPDPAVFTDDPDLYMRVSGME